LPSASPFDAILVSAAAPDVPPALKQQLAIGGRLIVPVGEFSSGQSLHQIIRKHESEYEEEDLGGVSFVPLVGEQAWTEDGRRAASNHRPGQSSGLSLAQMLAVVIAMSEFVTTAVLHASSSICSATKRFIVDYWRQDWSGLSVSSIVLRRS
jgi:hypothetical protein